MLTYQKCAYLFYSVFSLSQLYVLSKRVGTVSIPEDVADNRLYQPRVHFGRGDDIHKKLEAGKKLAKVYFDFTRNLTKEDLTPTVHTDEDDIRCLDDDGCVTTNKIRQFLDGKYIPGRESTPDPRFIDEGQWFDPQAKPLGIVLQFQRYILTRPREAVPFEVQEMLFPPGTDFETKWPGQGPRTKFMPPKTDPKYDIYEESDIEVYNTDQILENRKRAESLNDPDNWQPLREEEDALLRSKFLVQNFFYAKGLMAVVVPCILYILLARVLNGPPRVPALGQWVA